MSAFDDTSNGSDFAETRSLAYEAYIKLACSMIQRNARGRNSVVLAIQLRAARPILPWLCESRPEILIVSHN